MDPYEQLRDRARAKRDLAIEKARAEYHRNLRSIDKMASALNTRRRRKPVCGRRNATTFSEMTAPTAAEIVLREQGPLALVELVLELQRRGFRSQDTPQRVAHAVSQSMRYHGELFRRDEKGRWAVGGC